MRILFTADIHLEMRATDSRTGLTVLQQLGDCIGKRDPDAVVVAGDIGNSIAASRNLKVLREAVGDRKLAICLGNHDHWLDPELHGNFPSLLAIQREFWEKPAKEYGAVLLDSGNAVYEDVTLVGGYCHFDLGLAIPGLVVHGATITREMYLSLGSRIWNDFRYIPFCAAHLDHEAQAQAEAFATRLEDACARGARILVATHTCPWRGLNGHPRAGDASDLLSAYSGNSLIGSILESKAASLEFLMCGHTHYPVREHVEHAITCLNVGGDYGLFRGVEYDTGSKEIKWLGAPVQI